MNSKKKTSSTQDSTQTTTPAAAPDIQYALDQNRALYNQLLGEQPYPGQTYADFSPETTQGLDLTAQRALGGSPVVGAAQGAAGDIANNGFLTGGGLNFVDNIASGGATNPALQYLLPTAEGAYLDPSTNPAFQQGVNAINDSVGSIFERAGRTGSGANQSAVARGVGDLAAGIYNQERANQLNAANAIGSFANQDIANAFNANSIFGQNANARLAAAGLAPGLAGQDYIDLQNLLNVGTAKQNQTQQGINQAVSNYYFPYQNAVQAQQLLNSGIGSLAPELGGTSTGHQTGTTTETSNPGLFNSILGGLLTAGSIAAGVPGLSSALGMGAGAAGAAAAAPQLAFPSYNSIFPSGGYPNPVGQVQLGLGGY